MQFADLGLIEPILRAVRQTGYTTPTPIQLAAIPPALKGSDVLGCAQTGTGKTAAFTLPILQRLSAQPSAVGHGQHQRGPRPVRALVLTPTRELAVQIGENLRDYGRNLPLSWAVIYGGVGYGNQLNALRRGVDIVVATPGRLLDLMGQGAARLGRVEFLVLDEADRMLDMGFIHDIRKILQQVPVERQTFFFSATMPHEIRSLANGILRSPVVVEVAPVSSSAETVAQHVYHVDAGNKQNLLHHVLGDNALSRVLVFTRTKHGADKVVRRLVQGGIRAEAIHGNKSQNHRMRALANFRTGHVRVLVASDIAARGIDIDNISHVINFDIPHEPETYVHRIGRTGRAGAQGTALSFCAGEERTDLRQIERLIRKPIPVVDQHPYAIATPVAHTGQSPMQRPPQQRAGHAQRHAPHQGRRHGHGNSQGHGQGRGHSNAQQHRDGGAGHGRGPQAASQAQGFQVVDRPTFKRRARPPSW